MKRVVTLMAVTVVALFILGGCAAPGIPQGSVLRAEYQGVYKGESFWGNITVRVYDAPDGSRPVSGELHPVSGNVRSDFYGQMNGSRIEARFTQLIGAVTGEMSTNGQKMSGTFSFQTMIGPPAMWGAEMK